MNKDNEVVLSTRKGQISIQQSRITPQEYTEFLTRTDLGQQYPKERFIERIEKLVNNTQISLIAREENGRIIGNCFGLTDFAYWLLVTDIGIDREYVKNGIGKELMKIAREKAGGEKDIIVFCYANEEAIEFFEKIGMNKSKDMMELTDIEWTEFEVGKE
jgi:N-acetylglutamate synthase-like GNAT family acetyltransferase